MFLLLRRYYESEKKIEYRIYFIKDELIVFPFGNTQMRLKCYKLIIVNLN